MTDLELAYKELSAQVGFDLGFGRGSEYLAPTGEPETAWDSRQLQTITECVRGGLHDFYECGHDWTWKRPIRSVTLLSGQSTVNCPDDFGGKLGDVQLAIDDTTVIGTFPFSSPGVVNRRHTESPTSTGRPQLICLEPFGTPNQLNNQQWRIKVWPISDQDYNLTFPMFVLPRAMSKDFPYAYGGPQHAQTRLAACKAWAEVNIFGIVNGPQSMRYQQLLAASIENDRRYSAQYLGYNGNRMTRHRIPRGAQHWGRTTLTVNGVTYD